MAQQRTTLWEAELEEDLQDVDVNLAIGNYGQNGMYDDGERRVPVGAEWALMCPQPSLA